MAKTKVIRGKTDGMRYNPLVKGGKMTDHYHELKHYSEFNSTTSVEEKLVRLAFLTTDSESPTAKINDYAIKIKEGASLIEFNNNEVVEELLMSRNDFFRKCITRCCAIDNKYSYELWLSLVSAYSEMNYMLRLPITDAKDQLKAIEQKQKIGLKMQEWMKDIMIVERNLFKDEYTKEAVYLENSNRTIHYAEQFQDVPETIV